MRKAAYGFTLIELLVVIAITAVIGIYTLANYSSFGEDQNLKSDILDVQSLLRAAQTNAGSNVKCGTQYGATWQVEFAGASLMNLRCSASSNLQKTLQLNTNIVIQQVRGNNAACPLAAPFTISFTPLNNQINLGDARCTSLTITLKNIKTNGTKALVIEQGGRIYGQ